MRAWERGVQRGGAREGEGPTEEGGFTTEAPRHGEEREEQDWEEEDSPRRATEWHGEMGEEEEEEESLSDEGAWASGGMAAPPTAQLCG